MKNRAEEQGLFEDTVKASFHPLAQMPSAPLAWPGMVLAALLLIGGCAIKGQVRESAEPPPDPPLKQEVGPCSQLSARELEKRAIGFLDRGEVQNARTDLDCALELRPGSYRATSLIEQLDTDPVQKLGRTHFRYTVDNNDTLSKIAERFLGSNLKFVILARYNQIVVPADLKAGQQLKIPGDKETATEDAPDTPPATVSARSLRDQALAAETSGDLERAYKLIDRARELDAAMPNIGDQHAQIKDALIASFEEEAYAKEVAGAVDAAVALWRQVLAIDARNIPAQLALKRLGAE